MDRDQMLDELFLEAGRRNYRSHNKERLQEEERLLQEAIERVGKLGCTESGFNSFRKMSKSQAESIEWIPAPEIHPDCDKALVDDEWIYNLPHRVFPSMNYYSPSIARKYC